MRPFKNKIYFATKNNSNGKTPVIIYLKLRSKWNKWLLILKEREKREVGRERKNYAGSKYKCTWILHNIHAATISKSKE